MKIIFMGTPQLAADVLSGLLDYEDVEVCCVVTNADSKSKRGNKLASSPVKQVAQDNSIECITPAKLDLRVVDYLRQFDVDFICVAAYGKLLPKSVLDMPKYECLNVHGSLLPKWRGAAPIQRAILAGDQKVGISIMRMEQGLDTGDYCMQQPVNVGDKSISQIMRELALAGSHCLHESMIKISNGDAQWIQQDGSNVTYAEKLNKDELLLSLDDSTILAQRKIQCSDGSHPCKCVIGNKVVTVINGKADYDLGIKPGEVKVISKKLYIGFCDGSLHVINVKPDGKKTMDAYAFSSGLQGLKTNGVRWTKKI